MMKSPALEDHARDRAVAVGGEVRDRFRVRELLRARCGYRDIGGKPADG
jgi:hypothetical protein